MNRYLLTALTSAALLVPATNALAAPGDLDTTFSGDGLASVDFGSDDEGVGAAVQPDGKLVALGRADGGSLVDFAVARFNPDGTPDTSFSGDGRVRFRFSTGDNVSRDHATAIALQPDGKIVVVGDTDVAAKAGNEHDMAVARLNANGSLDTTFNGTGRQTIDYGQSDQVADVAVQADGRIVVGGSAVRGNDEDFAVARLTTDGKLDPTWSSDGKAATHFQVAERLNGITIAPDGEVVAAGQFQAVSTNIDTALARYTTDGELQPAFSGDGKQIISLGSKDSAVDITAQPDGKLLLAVADLTFQTSDTVVARLTGAGDLDTTFGTGGKTVAPGEAPNRPAAVTLTSSGHVLVAANVIKTNDLTSMMAFEVDADGHAVASFGRDGVAQIDTDSGQFADDVAVAGNRALIVGGDSANDLAVDAIGLEAVAQPPEGPPAGEQPSTQPPAAPQAPQASADTLAPALSKLKLKRVRTTEKGTFKASEQSKVVVTVQRKAGKRLKAFRTIKLTAKPGANSFALKKLKRGSYKVTVRATDGAGNASKPVKATFVRR
jgi:uncharacterized delta-60 repeat protein